MEKVQYSWNDFEVDLNGYFLGQGGFSLVLKGRLTGKSRPMAVKLITETFCLNQGLNYEEGVESLLLESDILEQAQVSGVRNTIQIFGTICGGLPKELIQGLRVVVRDIRENEKTFGIIVEYFDGVPLSTVLHRAELSSSLVDRLYILKEVALAIADMHDFGIVHGDIKPQNILMSSQSPPTVKIIDFGLSSSFKRDFGKSSTHITFHPKGTPFYCAPEMLPDPAHPRNPVVNSSRTTDMYALAITAWEILSKRKAFQTESNFPQCILAGTRPDLAALPEDLPIAVISCIVRCWNSDRKMRLSSREFLMIINHEYEIVKDGQFDIFFSHASVNKPFLNHVYAFLIKAGYRVWFDMQEMGHDLSDSMVQGIQHSKAVLVCLSKVFTERPSCQYELKTARELNKPIVSIFLEPDIQNHKSFYIDICELSKKLYVDVGHLAVRNSWYNKSGVIPEDLLHELFDKMNILLHVLSTLGLPPHPVFNLPQNLPHNDSVQLWRQEKANKNAEKELNSVHKAEEVEKLNIKEPLPFLGFEKMPNPIETVPQQVEPSTSIKLEWSLDVMNTERTAERWRIAIEKFASLNEKLIHKRGSERITINVLIDVSGSMAGNKLTAVKLGLCALVGSLNFADLMNITLFSSKSVSSTGGFKNVASVKANLPKLLEKLEANGGTLLYDTIIAGMGELREVAEIENRNIMVALTDGADTESQHKPDMIKYRLGNPGIHNFMFLAVAVDMQAQEEKVIRSWMDFVHTKEYNVDVNSGKSLVTVFREMLVERILLFKHGFFHFTEKTKTAEEVDIEDLKLLTMENLENSEFEPHVIRLERKDSDPVRRIHSEESLDLSFDFYEEDEKAKEVEATPGKTTEKEVKNVEKDEKAKERTANRLQTTSGKATYTDGENKAKRKKNDGRCIVF